MTAREIKDINREISRLRAKMARIQAEADNTAVTLGERIVPSGQTSDRVAMRWCRLQIFKGIFRTLKFAEIQP